MSPQAAKSFVSNPENVARHAFYPFVEFDILSRRYRTVKEPDSSGKKIKRRKSIAPKKRPIKLSSHKDGYVFSYYARKLSDLYEELVWEQEFAESVIAYRPNMGTNYSNAVEAFQFLKGTDGAKVITLDITSFFENLDHRQLKQKWQEVLLQDNLPKDHYKIFRALTKYSTVRIEDVCSEFGLSEKDIIKGQIERICSSSDFRKRLRGKVPKIIEVHSAEYGIPQGSAMSAVLSNIYMLDFDREIYSLCKKHGIFYRRYCDDVIFIQPLSDELEILTEAKNTLLSSGPNLLIHEDKTKRYIYDGEQVSGAPIEYLGLTFDGKKVLIRSGSLAKFHRKLRVAVAYRKSLAKRRTGNFAGKVFLRSLYRRYTWKLSNMSFHGYAQRVDRSTSLSSVKRQLRKSQVQLERLLK